MTAARPSVALLDYGLGNVHSAAKALEAAGADAIFPEAMATLDEFAAIRDAVQVPILANMTEFGKSALFTHQQLQDVGVNLAIHPVSLLRIAMGAIERELGLLAETGTLDDATTRMQTRARLYELNDYAAYNAFDEGVFNFDVPGAAR